eukprot:350263_1
MLCSCCDAPETEEKLYQCKIKGCRIADKWYCKPCGNTTHQRSNHKFLQNIPYDHHENNYKEEKSHKAQALPVSSSTDKHAGNYIKYFVSGSIGSVGVGLALNNVMPVAVEPIAAGVTAGGTTIVAGATTIAATGFVAAVAVTAYSICSSKKNNPTKDPKVEAQSFALQMFDFDENDVKNSQRFNTNTISKRYRRMAKYYHPDRKHGDNAVWIRLDVARHVLLSMTNPNDFRFPMEDAYKLFCKDEIITQKNKKAIEHPNQLQHTNQNVTTKLTKMPKKIFSFFSSFKN